MDMQVLSAPLHWLMLHCSLVQGEVAMGVRPALPVPGISVILGNDLAGSKVWSDVSPSPVVTSKPVVRELADPQQNLVEVFPACVVTRAQSCKIQGPQETKVDSGEVVSLSVFPLSVSRSELADQQRKDPSIQELLAQVRPESEMSSAVHGYFLQEGVLVRKWLPQGVGLGIDRNLSIRFDFDSLGFDSIIDSIRY